MLKSDVLKYFGTRTAVARFLKISSSAVTQWQDIIPEKQAYRLENLTNGKLKVDASLYQDDSSQEKTK